MTEATRARVYQWAYRLLQNHHDALDATQDVLMKWLRHAGREIESGEAWLRRTTVNHCIDLIRKRRPMSIGDGAASLPQRDRRSATDDDLRDRIAAGLSRLTDSQRATVVAKVYDGQRFTTIAESFGVSVSTVKTHYIRGLQALRASLADLGED